MGGDMSKYRAQRPAKIAYAIELLKKKPNMTASALGGRIKIRFGSALDHTLQRELVMKAKAGKLEGQDEVITVTGSFFPKGTPEMEREVDSLLQHIRSNYTRLEELLKEQGATEIVINLSDWTLSYEKTIKEKQSFKL
jgi:hypothetical protein